MATKEEDKSDFQIPLQEGKTLEEDEKKSFLARVEEFKFIGLFLLVSASVTSALMSVFVKQITEVDPAFMVVLRNGVVAVAIGLYLAFKRTRPTHGGMQDMSLLVMRGSTFFIYGTALFYSFR